MLKRFLDNIVSIFFGTTKRIHQLFKEINEIHPTLKFTFEHTNPEGEPLGDRCECDNKHSIPFLDTQCSIVEGQIEIDLYKKDTDRNQYILPSSCHPYNTTKYIPYSLGLRIIRICTSPENRDKNSPNLSE